MAKQLRITLVRSVIGRPEPQRRTVEALGLKKINQVVEHEDTPQIRGMINKVSHLVQVEELCGRCRDDICTNQRAPQGARKS